MVNFGPLAAEIDWRVWGTPVNSTGFTSSLRYCTDIAQRKPIKLRTMYTLRCVVDAYVNSGSTVNIRALDLSKAFDKMNHCGLFIKLTQRRIPNNLLSICEHWFSVSSTCVKWGTYLSCFFNLKCGVRQGGVLSPYLFAVYIYMLCYANICT